MRNLKITFFFFFVALFGLKAQIALQNIVITPTTCKDSLAGSISFDVNGGTPPYTYIWSSNLNGANIQKGLKAGQYSVTISDGMKQITKHFSIDQPKPIKMFYHHDCYFFFYQDKRVVFDSIQNAIFPIRWQTFAYNLDSKKMLIPNNYWDRNISNLSEGNIYTLFGGEPKDSSLVIKYIMTDANGCKDSVENVKLPVKGFTYSPKFPANGIKINLYANDPHNELVITFNKQNIVPATIFTNLKFYPANREEVKDFQWYRNDVFYNCPKCESIKLNICENAIYKLVISDLYGCEAEDEIQVICKDSIIQKDTTVIIVPVKNNTTAYLPTAFSPNDDGINDYFTVFSGGEVTKVVLMQVYDRWGGLLFENQDFEPNVESYGWNGKQRGTDMPQGNYTYTMRLLLKDGSKKTAKGEVLLIR